MMMSSAFGDVVGRVRRPGVKVGDSGGEPGQDAPSRFVGDDLGVAGRDAVDGQLGDDGRVGLGHVQVAGHVGVHVADVQGGHPGALGRQLQAQGVGQ